MSNRIRALCFAGAVLGAGLATAGQLPQAVSPGDPDKLALVEARCPTFSWAAVDDAESYELVVYRTEEDVAGGEPVLLETLTGAATAWTPSLDRCLKRGGRYAWSVRARGPEGPSAWSTAALFQVASARYEPDLQQALEVVRRYLTAEAASAGLGGEVEASAAPDEEISTNAVETRAAVGANTQLLVQDASIAVTSTDNSGRAFIQLDTRFDVAPLSTDCNELREAGRLLLVIRPSPEADELYVCVGAGGGWDRVEMTP